MTPAQAKADLALELLEHGEDVVLRRRVGTGSTFNDVTVRALVRGYKPDELIGGITQQDSKVIFGVEEIVAAGWPLTAGGPSYSRNGDFMTIGEALRSITASAPIRLAGEIVRIEATVKG